jgi:hypothetical protein
MVRLKLLYQHKIHSFCVMAYIYYIMALTMQGIITAPMLYAMEEFPQLQEVVDRGFDNPANVEIVSSFF